ncbi:hypothetical protein TNCV_4060981 [Trichonephila clavipes]|nr:hypothetical protein TNCV_4060981 [Trichonephila clavipes]
MNLSFSHSLRFISLLELITDLLGTPSEDDTKTACHGARSHILRRPHKANSMAALYTLSSQATHEAVHLLCQMLVFNPAKRISCADALSHPYMDEGRLRYHSCMCRCCQTTPAGRQYIADFEPVSPHVFDDCFEKDLTSVHQVKDRLYQFIFERYKGLYRMPLCINPHSAAFKSFTSRMALHITKTTHNTQQTAGTGLQRGENRREECAISRSLYLWATGRLMILGGGWR